MDRIFQWAWHRYGARYSWAMWAIGVPLVLQVYLLFSIVVLAFEESDRYVEAGAVTVVARDIADLIDVTALAAADRGRADKTYKGQKITVHGLVGGFRQDRYP